MDKLTAIKIKYNDGTYSDEIPISVLSENVEWDSAHTLVEVLGSIDVDAKGTIQAQIDKLSNNTQLNDGLQWSHTNSGISADIRRCIVFGIVFPHVCVGKAYIGLVEDGIQAFCFLRLIVVQRLKGNFAEKDDGNDVDDGFQSHGDVCKAPGHVQAVAGADEDHDCGADAEDSHHGRILGDKQDIGLRIEVVADDGRKGEQAHDHSHKVNTDGANDTGHALLQERDSGVSAVCPIAGQKDQEYGCGADQQRIDIDGDDLRKSLLGGVGDRRGSTGVGRGTHTGLVREEASLDAEHHTGTGKAAKDGFEVECILHDDCEHAGKSCDIGDDHKETDRDIQSCHDRNKYRRNLSNDVACKEDVEGRHRKHKTDCSRKNTTLQIGCIHGERRHDIVGLQTIKAECERCDQGNRKDDAQPSGVECSLNIIGRSALEGVAFFFLIDLRQCTFDISGCGAQNRHEPHPESSAGTAENDRSGDACHIAGADAGCCGDHQCLERRYAFVAFFLFHHAVERVLKEADLHKACANSEVDAASRQKIDQKPRIEHVVDLCQDFR